MVVKVTLKEYLSRLERMYGAEKVPTLQDIAENANTTRVSISRIANNRMKMLNVTILGAVIQYLRECGYETTVADILVFEGE